MAKAEQNYISKELSHFVGRKSLGKLDVQYDLLKKILNEGRITWDPYAPHTKGVRAMGLHGNLAGDISSNTMYNPNMVCFCDIPSECLSIHTRKYGVCGLSFTKAFLAEKGAFPVFYIPKNVATAFNKPLKDFEILFDALKMCPTACLSSKVSGLHADTLEEIKFLIHFKLLSYIKCFDDTLPDEDENNFYFEREWRSLYDVEFELSDVVRVFIPGMLANQFHKSFPTYSGVVMHMESA